MVEFGNNERPRDEYGRFIKIYDDSAVSEAISALMPVGLKNSVFKANTSERMPCFLNRREYINCCAYDIMYNFLTPCVYDWRESYRKFDKMKLFRHNIRQCIVNSIHAQRGGIFATINHRQKAAGWDTALEAEGFVLLCATSNPSHFNTTRVFTYVNLFGAGPVVYNHTNNNNESIDFYTVVKKK